MPKPTSTPRVTRYLERQLRLCAPGAALPSVRQVMGECRVGPQTVAEAIRKMHAQQMLEVRPQSGIYRPLAGGLEPQIQRVDVLYFNVEEKNLRDQITGAAPPDELTFHGQMVAALRRLGPQRGYAMHLHVAGPQEAAGALVERIVQDEAVRHCLTISLTEASLLRTLHEHHLAVVNLHPAGFFLPTNTIATDPDVVIGLQIRHLGERGHRCIGYLHNLNEVHPHRDLLLRREAFYRLCIEHEVQLHRGQVAYGGYDTLAIAEVVRRMLASPHRPTGLICADQHLPGVYAAARELGLVIGRDLSVVGTDDKPVAEQVDPPATTLRVPRAESVTMALDLLEAVVAGREVPAENYIRAPVHLVERASVGPAPS